MTSLARPRARTRSLSPRAEAWTAVGLGLLAWYVALPPLLVRTPLPSLALAALGAALALHARRRGLGRLAWGALAAALAGAAGSLATVASGASHLQQVVVWSALLATTVRYATPILFGALGGVISERGGVVALGLEGMILVGAYFGIFGADVTGSWVLGLGIAVLAGLAIAALHAVWSIALRADQIISGIALNLLALGLTTYLFLDRYGDPGTPPGIAAIPDVRIPALAGIPFVGPTLAQSNLMTWLAGVLTIAIAVFLFRTPQGLRLRVIGEHPKAAASAGLKVARTRYLAVLASGALASLGGAYLSIGFVHSFSQNMTAGRGYIALAAVIFGAWRPGGALAAALLFGFGSALSQRLPVFSPTVAVLLTALPYVLTLLALLGTGHRSRPPAANGKPYVSD
ncbi:MAG TPA: ABC transporter permease [Conexibacter sp.]|nr:ABC transporter permease [Conexibacter sp.]